MRSLLCNVCAVYFCFMYLRKRSATLPVLEIIKFNVIPLSRICTELFLQHEMASVSQSRGGALLMINFILRNVESAIEFIE